MSFKCSIELVGGPGECQNLLEKHQIVTIRVEKSGKVVDRFNATIEDLVDVDWFNTRINEKTAYLKLKSFVAKKQQ